MRRECWRGEGCVVVCGGGVVVSAWCSIGDVMGGGIVEFVVSTGALVGSGCAELYQGRLGAMEMVV